MEAQHTFQYITIQVDDVEKEYFTPRDEKQLDRKFKYCKVLAHYFTCKLKTVLVSEHYQVTNYFTGAEILVPEHKETAYHFNHVAYSTLYRCEKEIANTIEGILSNE